MPGDAEATPPSRPRGEPGLIPEWDMAPGGPRAVDRGCLCSVLANAAFRARADVEPFVDPRCPIHASHPVPPTEP